ncbi:MAG TPA: hypothetical protein VEK14_07100, partial [Rhodomicrobium sp.]|nr:hypothetical protein [Rhodomicrobium sp.]
LWLGVNLGTGAAFGDMLPRLRQLPEGDAPWSPPEPSVRAAAGPSWSKDKLEARIRPLLDHALSQDMQPFLRAMRRRLDRDCARVHAYHEELRRAALTKLAALGGGESDKAEAARRRESLRIEAIEREYRLKLDDLRNNYAVSVVVEWIQALDLYLPVHRIEIEIHRRKGRRAICLDWHPILRAPELPPTDWGAGLTRTRLVCDDRLHLTEPEGQAPCASCGKPWCRACHPSACPRCR